ncbi:hypothetical protein BDW02DRAFT_568151 [Decorospora gaudefroyi]|uniref:HTH araC/xylS-type domain-containing protein n=1 Tax=Decorospora gaudefroyi TaxID=184978 RepID=A0A6A5KHP5_9PLEO|nr:hypothetical protein BDW02DRAFT_568151 [Decorospora gaudefroyi]
MPALLSLEPTSISSRRWAALRTRDPSANSAFFYGAMSTLIFCRPTCPARLARRANIVYFDNISAAQTAGYRPCKRCNPCNTSWHREMRSWNDLIQAQNFIAIAAVERQDWSVAEIAAKVGVSIGHLYRLFRKYAHTTPREFANASAAAELQGHCYGDEIRFASSEDLSLPSIEPEPAVPQSTSERLVWLPWDSLSSDLEQFVQLDGGSSSNAIPDQVFFTTI